MDCKVIATTYTIWLAIKLDHEKDLVIFATRTSMSEGIIETQYGLRGADFPLMQARTTWDPDEDDPSNRINEQHCYWLCVPAKEDD